MATSSIPIEPDLAPAVRWTLSALRRRIRRYVWLEGLSSGVAWLGAAFWLSLAIDWLFEPSPLVRGLLLGLVGLVLAVVLVQLVARRAFVRLTDSNMAMLLERRFGALDDSLLTAVDLVGRSGGPTEFDPLMLARACRQAAERIGRVRLAKVFNPLPLRRSMLSAVLLSISVGAFAVMFPSALDIWARRALAFSGELWPRRTKLAVRGFDGGVAKVARGGDLEVLATADARWPLVPQVVEVRYRTENGFRGREPMSRVGAAEDGRDPFQQYAYTFRGVLASIRFDLAGGDDCLRDLLIEVVESPTIVSMELDCEFPPYMGRRPQRSTVTGPMQIPQGTRLGVRARANKDIVRVRIDSVIGQQQSLLRLLELAPGSDRRGFAHTLESLDQDQTLLFTLEDTDEITSREPGRLSLSVRLDQPPQLEVELRGIGSAITPQARLPIEGKIADDYGLDRVWFEYRIDQRDPDTRPIDSYQENLTEVKLDEALEVGDLKLKPGNKLNLGVNAADRCDLAEKPNVGTSSRWMLDVVSAEQLRTLLQSRELVLRQRFETIIQDVVESRDSLLRIDFAAAADGSDPAESASEEKKPSPRAAEPADGAAETEPDDVLRRLGLWKLRVERARQNGHKDAHETLGVAEAFDHIRMQLVNNRIDTEELKNRLAAGIAAPLRRVAEEMFPELQRRLQRLQDTLDDGKLGPENRNRATGQLDAILAEMRQVLDRMIELEDYNELVEMLRAIIQSQEKLTEQTRRRHKEKLRELLED